MTAMNLMQLGHHGGVVPLYARTAGAGLNYGNMKYSFPRNVSARRIRIDFSAGGTSNVGLLYVTNTIAAAKALMRNNFGDRIMFKGGTTLVGLSALFGTLANMAGLSSIYPTMIGTYDPNDPDNEANDNTLWTNFDLTGIPASQVPNAVFFLVNSAGDNFVFSHLKGIGDDVCYSVSFFFMLGARSNILYDRILTDGLTMQDQGLSVASGPANAIASITSSGTTATVTVGSTALLTTGMLLTHYGATETVFDIQAAITVIDATHYSYVFAGNANNPATPNPSLLYCLPVMSWPATDFANNIIHHRCGYMYGTGVNTGNHFSDKCFPMLFQETSFFHAGYSRNIDRNRAPASTLIKNSAPGATNVGAIITIDDTSALKRGMICKVSSGVGVFPASTIVLSVLSPTTFLASNTPTTVFSGGATVVNITDVGPDIFKHSEYSGQANKKVRFIRCNIGQDSSNVKMTGGNIDVIELFQVRNPMGFLSDPNANIVNGYAGLTAPGWNAYWPAGSTVKNFREVIVDADDVNYNPSTPRGWGSQLFGVDTLSGHYRPVLINQTNPAQINGVGSGGDYATSRSYASFIKNRETVQVNWFGTQTSVAANTTKVWLGCITEDAAGVLNAAGTASSGNLNRTTLANLGINNLTNLSMYGSFKSAYSELAALPVVNNNTSYQDKKDTEALMWQYMCGPAGVETFWRIRTNLHFRASANI